MSSTLARLRDAEIIDEVEAGGDAKKVATVHNDGDKIAAEQRYQLADRRVARDCFETRHHHVLHW